MVTLHNWCTLLHTMSIVATAINHIGLTKLADRFGYYPSAVQKWAKNERLPISELSGITNYAAVIEEMSEGRYPAAKLIAETRRAWEQDIKKSRARKLKPNRSEARLS